MHATARLLCLQVLSFVLVCAGCSPVSNSPNHAGMNAASVAGESTATRLLPTVSLNLAPSQGWPHGSKPTPAYGLAVNAYATGIDRPRWIHVLPNGDVLVAEAARPADKLAGLRAWLAARLPGLTNAPAAGTD